MKMNIVLYSYLGFEKIVFQFAQEFVCTLNSCFTTSRLLYLATYYGNEGYFSKA